MALAAAAGAAIPTQALRDEHVRAAIEAIVGELHARKHPQRFWEPAEYTERFESRQKGGWTALTVLALLHAGLSYQDPVVHDAIEYLDRLPMEATYAVAVRAHVWAMLPPKFLPNLEADAAWLLDGFAEQHGGWYYEQRPPPNQIDHSLAQYGALALWEAAKRGVDVNRRTWQLLEDRFINKQLADGGWNYLGEGPPTGSMTTAGLTVLSITLDFLHAPEFIELERARDDAYIRSMSLGLNWMDQHFTVAENPGRDTYFYYYLYGVERVGLASGYKFFAGKDWFREGAAAIIDRLCDHDSVSGAITIKPAISKKQATADGPIADLAFALMFLSRGRVPVALNKLSDDSTAWNNRPRDAANLTAWIGARAEAALNWQIVRLDAEPEQWLDAPLLYLASHEAPGWMKPAPDGPMPSELVKLRRFLDLGGMILAVNEGSGRAFAESVERAGGAMYPHLAWADVPDDHFAYTMLWPVQGRRPALRALSNGVRDLIILSPTGDLSKAFQLRPQEGTESHFALMGNIYLYASEMNEARPRLAEHVSRFPASPANPHATVVRAIHNGAWNVEPLALQVFASSLAEQADHPLTIALADHPLESIHQLNPRPAIVMVSGLDAPAFTAAQLDAIKAYTLAGGVMLFETTGGRGDFAASAEIALANHLGIPARSLSRSRMITGDGLDGAAKLSRLDFRPYAQEVFGSRETAPRLRGIVIDGQPRLIFSREDICHALLDQPKWGVVGYTSSTARNLLANIIRHAIAGSN